MDGSNVDPQPIQRPRRRTRRLRTGFARSVLVVSALVAALLTTAAPAAADAVVTVEAGGSRDDLASEVANLGLERYFHRDDVYADAVPVTVLEHSKRLELAAHARARRLYFGRQWY